MKKSLVHVAASTLVLAFLVVPIAAQTQTPSQVYLAYRSAFDKAKSVDDILPFMAKEQRDQVSATPAAERADMFEMIKMFGALTNVKVLSETLTPTGATLTAEGIDPDKARTTGTITLVKEGGAWKLSKESWKH